MAAELTTLHVKTRRQWRSWLKKHHASSPGVWLVFYKAHTGVSSIPYEDMIREALCFGWIDSLVKRLDDNRYALKSAGQLTPAGLAAAPTKNTYAPNLPSPSCPAISAKR